MAVSYRSTTAINDFVLATDELSSLIARQKHLEAELKRLTPEVLAQIGERREVRVNRQIRILSPRVEEKISRACTDEEIVDFCKAHGLHYQERSPEYVAPASFSKYVRENLIPEELIERKTTIGVSVI